MGLREGVCRVFSMSCAIFGKSAEDIENEGDVGAIFSRDCDAGRDALFHWDAALARFGECEKV